MYEILERFSEVLDRDLSAFEREELLQSLAEVRRNGENADLSELAGALQNYLYTQKRKTASYKPNFLDRIRIGWLKFERKYLKRSRLKIIIVIGLLGWGIWALVSPIFYFSISNDPLALQKFLDQLISNNLVRNASGLNWFEARVILEGGFGMLACLAAILILCKAEKLGTWIGLISLLISLTIVNLLVFYFDQFSTILMASVQFALLVLLLRYKKRFMSSTP